MQFFINPKVLTKSFSDEKLKENYSNALSLNESSTKYFIQYVNLVEFFGSFIISIIINFSL